MIELLIDGQRADLSEDFALPKGCVSFDFDKCGDLSALRSGHSVELEIPASRSNDRLLGFPADSKGAERFNEAYHKAEIVADGATLMSGVVHLLSTKVGQNGAKSYSLKVHQGGVDWVESLARTTLDKTDMRYGVIFDGDAVEQSWTEDVAVRFLPINYDSYADVQDENSLIAAEQIMTLDSYYPFLSVEKVVKAIFAQAGYEVQSRFFESEEFRQLHISGKFATMDQAKHERLKAYTGFEAGRTSTASAVASSTGRVWLSDIVLQNSVGKFVNTTEGEGLYNSGSVLKITDEGLSYHPKSTQMVGFEYEFHYKTEYSILSRERLQGFDSIYVGSGADMRFELRNPYKDCQAQLQPNMEYMCCIFDYEAGQSFRLIYSSAGSQIKLADIADRTAMVTSPQSIGMFYGLEMQLKNADGTYSRYEGDWALYEGYVATQGEVEVAVKLRTRAEQITPAAGKSFDSIYIYGAREGQRLTLLEGCRLRAVFSPTPTIGTFINWEDVSPKDVTQLELMEALQQMFNLRFFSSDTARKVYVEPREDWMRSTEKDWRKRLVYSDCMTFSDSAEGVSRERILGYRTETDGAVERFNQETQSKLGEWSYTMKSFLSKPQKKRILSELFSPTLTLKTDPLCPSAEIMQVGDRDSESETFTMRVIIYRGLKPLGEGEKWGYPSFSKSYPYATFCSDDGFTLTFEDRNGAEGLHRHYDAEWQAQDECQELTAEIRILPHEMELLLDPERADETFGSRYLLSISGESALFRLQAIESYDVGRAVARCRFRRTLEG